ncbi:MAG: DUF2268 domain-containing putative Zn-dependent protease [Tannerella sp.]|jgi:hypothetical protein|nr:DUF2268 domain-containing putative Zn-dependent protease [Tannerella sp.]
MKLLWLSLFTAVFTFCGCGRKSLGLMDDSNNIHINRFDSALFRWIDSDDAIILKELKEEYPQMLEILGKALFQTSNSDTSVFFDYLINYYSEPTLKSLYRDAITFYSADSSAIKPVEKEFSYGFIQLKKLFPSMPVPAIYMHVSGLRQNMIVADSLLSCSIDKYMGSDYPLYEDFFYDFQRKSMTPERIVKDGLGAWIKSEYPYPGKENVLLDRMIYEGKIIYILTLTGYDCSYQNIMSLTDSEYKWCLNYESELWKTLIERKHLYTPDIVTTSKYFQPSPSVFISEDAPGNIGYFTGYRIVERYMKQTKSTCEELIKNNDAQDILQKSKYKP